MSGVGLSRHERGTHLCEICESRGGDELGSAEPEVDELEDGRRDEKGSVGGGADGAGSRQSGEAVESLG